MTVYGFAYHYVVHILAQENGNRFSEGITCNVVPGRDNIIIMVKSRVILILTDLKLHHRHSSYQQVNFRDI